MQLLFAVLILHVIWGFDAEGKSISHEYPSKGELLAENNNVQEFDGFISYRRSSSRHLATLIRLKLEEKNISAFLDVESLGGGLWEEQLMDSIRMSPNFILVLSNGTLERCKGDFNYTDFVHKEIKQAVDFGKNIVLVFDSFDWPPSELFSPEINFALTRHGIVWEQAEIDQSVERLIALLYQTNPMPEKETIHHPTQNGTEFDGFISYRRSTSKHFASLINEMLERHNISTYFDVDDPAENFTQSVELAPNYIVLLSAGSLQPMEGDYNYTDYLHREIKTAVDLGKRIVPVFDEFDWPSSEGFSAEVNFVLANQGVAWQHYLAEQSLERLISYMTDVNE